jgi:hypothetical protein
MHIPQSTIEPFGVLGFPRRYHDIQDPSDLVRRIKNSISVLIHRSIRDGFAEENRDAECFISDSAFMDMMEHIAKLDGASTAFATIYGLWKNHLRYGKAFFIKFKVPNDSSWHTLTVRRGWD